MRAYRIVNLVMLGLILYALVFTIVSPFMEKLLPSLWRCNYRAITGKPCPFCGLTGDMGSFLASGCRSGSYENGSFPLLLRIYFGCLVLRVFFSAASFRWNSRQLPWIDGGTHLVFLSIVFLL